jgi:hypothetical protein
MECSPFSIFIFPATISRADDISRVLKWSSMAQLMTALLRLSMTVAR